MDVDNPVDTADNSKGGAFHESIRFRYRALRAGHQGSRHQGGLNIASILSLADFEEAGRRHLPRALYAYVSGGVEDNVSLAANRAAFGEYAFVPRVLADVSKRSQAATLFGRTYAAPFGIAPMGICAMTAYRGDLVLARGAAAENALMIFSGSSLICLEKVINEVKENPPWFQAYLPGDVPRIEALIERVARAGYETLVLTVDVPVAANREHNVRAGFSTPLRPSLGLAWDGLCHPRWLFGTFLRTLVAHGMPHFENNYATRGAGADGIIVSNHGGRQLDGAISPLRVLPEIAAECPRIPVMMDSGVRRGTDVLKALALGAKFVFAGRPFNYAAALEGESGVRRAIRILSAEVSTDMAMLGITSLEQLTRDQLRRVDER